MNRKTRRNRLLAAGLLILTALVLLIYGLSTVPYRMKIPDVPDHGNLSDAVTDQIQAVTGYAKKRPSADNLGMLGMIYHSSSRYDEAEICYQLAIKKSGSDWTWEYYLGYLKSEMGESAEAIRHFNRASEMDTGVDLAYYYAGIEYRNLGQTELAEKAFSRIRSIYSIPSGSGNYRQDHFPIGAHATYELSRIFMESGRLEEAEKLLNDILKATPSFGPAYRLLGTLYLNLGDPELSARYGVRANDLVVQSPPVDTLIDRLALISRSEFYLLKKIDEAERNIYPKWAGQLVDHAIQYLSGNKYLLSKAIRIYIWTGRHEEAAALNKEHIGMFADDMNELRKTGMLYLLNGMYSEAIPYFRQALTLDPADFDLNKNLALSLWYTEEPQESIDLLHQLAESNAENPEALAEIANILFFNFHNDKEAGDYLAMLKPRAPSNPKVLKLQAGIAEKRGDFREAIRLYGLSVRGDPEDLKTIRYLGNLLYEQKLWKESIILYREALSFHPNDPYFLERAGTLLVASPDTTLRDYDAGRELLERAFYHKTAQINTLISSGRSLAWTYAKLGNLPDAISIITETIHMGRREGISRSYMAELEALYQNLSVMAMKN